MRNPLIVKLIVAVDLLYTIFLVSIIVLSVRERSRDMESPQEVLSVEDSFPMEEEEIEEEIYWISVCHVDNCVQISSENCVKDGVVDENAVYQEVLDKVLPFFEKGYGGKDYVSNKGGGFMYWKQDIIPDLRNVFKDVYDAFNTHSDTTVRIEIGDLPGTDGKYAHKYIEIDNSKQKLYAWIDGKVEKEILLSGPKAGYEVYGVFPIYDKGLAPVAPGGKYMPYWMGFYNSRWQNSWYGLHALIWWYDGEGNKVYESVGNIGLRKSAGCIRMLLEDAKYLYYIFERGDLVLIHE